MKLVGGEAVLSVKSRLVLEDEEMDPALARLTSVGPAQEEKAPVAVAAAAITASPSVNGDAPTDASLAKDDILDSALDDVFDAIESKEAAPAAEPEETGPKVRTRVRPQRRKGSVLLLFK